MKGCHPHFTLSSLLTSPPQTSRPISHPFQEKQKKKTSHHPAQPRSERPNEKRACPTPNTICLESAHRPHAAPEDGPVHTRNESVFVHVGRRMFPFPLKWNAGMGEGCRSDRGGGGNVRGLSHSPCSARLSERVQVSAVGISAMTVQIYAPLKCSIAVAQ